MGIGSSFLCIYGICIQKYKYNPNSGDQRDCHDHKQDHFLKVKEQELSVTLQSWRYYLLILVSVIVAIFVSINYLFGI